MNKNIVIDFPLPDLYIAQCLIPQVFISNWLLTIALKTMVRIR